MINIASYIEGERVVCAFPIIGQVDGFVEAEVVTSNGDENEPATRFTVRRVKRSGEVVWTGASLSSFPAAIRIARKNCGWG